MPKRKKNLPTTKELVFSERNIETGSLFTYWHSTQELAQSGLAQNIAIKGFIE